jgi:hypothetical protein
MYCYVMLIVFTSKNKVKYTSWEENVTEKVNMDDFHSLLDLLRQLTLLYISRDPPCQLSL